MTVPVVPSALDVALWFFDQSRRDDKHMPAQKLQRLLWIAQGLYAAENHGRMLMPATFVAEETGPTEPTVFHAFEDSRPQIMMRKMVPVADNFLNRIWSKYGHHSADYLNRMMTYNDVYRRAYRKEVGTVIPFEQIAQHFTQKPEPKSQVKTSDGRILRKWTPTAKPVLRQG
ncbi:MAG: hypothetical protein P1V34_02025 [Alphaproteobacteria bacterium]|nr:hypothetical protein [Alphaproteobacteria bacterium]